MSNPHYSRIEDPNAIVQGDWQYSYDGGGITGVVPDIGPVKPEWVGQRARDTGTAWEYFLEPQPEPKPREHLTKDEAHALGRIVRESPASADSGILWAVRHHLGLYYHGLASAEEVCDALLRAANGHSDTNIVSVLGLDRSLQFSGRPMLPRPVVNPLAEVLSRGVNLYRTYGLVAGDPADHGTAPGKWVNDASEALRKL